MAAPIRTLRRPLRGERSERSTRDQGARFALSGGVVALFYIAVTTALAEGLGVRFQLALAVGFAAAIALHFTLQRLFVFTRRGTFALALRHQLWRYLAVAGVQYAFTAAITSVAPEKLGVSVALVYVVTAVIVSALNFLVLRNRVFHETSADGPTPEQASGSV